MWSLILIKTLTTLIVVPRHTLKKCTYICMGIILGYLIFMTTGCSESPQCVPGRTVACPCVPSGQGIQRCAEDGSRFLECECAHSEPLIQSLSGAQAHLSTTVKSKQSKVEKSHALHNQPLSTSFARPKYAVAASLQSSARDDSKSAKVIALEAKIEDAKVSKRPSKPSMTATKMFKLNMRNQQKKWWFYSETLERCVHAENVNGIDYAPLKLLSEGCYRLGRTDEMTVRCDDPPLGPQTYRFSDQERDCISRRSARNRPIKHQVRDNQGSQKVEISVLEPVIEAHDSKKRKRRRNMQDKSMGEQRIWHCMCYEEVVKGSPTLSTACRPTRAMCKDLTNKVKVGSPILVKGSLTARCQERRGSAPWNAFKGKGARRYFWQPSSHPGAWWSAEGCFLKSSRIRSKTRKPKGHKRNTASPKEQDERIPSEFLRPIGTSRSLIKYGQSGSAPKSERCEESCRANLASSRERRELYGVSEVPPLLRWGKKFAERVKLVKTICMSNQGKTRRGREVCLNKVISKCAKYCERTED